MTYDRITLVALADIAEIKGENALAILRLRQSIEEGIKQNGRITRPVVLKRINELKSKINEKVSDI